MIKYPQSIAPARQINNALSANFNFPSLNKTIGPNPAPVLSPATVAPIESPVCKNASAIAIDAAQFGISPNNAAIITWMFGCA